VADGVGVVADGAAGAGVEADDAAGVEVFLPALVSAVAKVELRLPVPLFADEVGQRHTPAVPLDEHVDGSPFDALVGLVIGGVAPRRPRLRRQVLAAPGSEGV